MAKDLKANPDVGFYEPFFVLSDFWCYRDMMTQLNDTTPEANLTLTVAPLSMFKYTMMASMDISKDIYAEWGLSQDMDQMKQMLSETNFYLLILTVFVSLAHTVLEMLAFKNDIHFWKDRDSMKGISVRTLFIQTGMSIVIFLYLLDNEESTSYLILLPAGLGILLDFWKISKACKVSTKPNFPWISIEDKDSTVLMPLPLTHRNPLLFCL